MSKEAAEVIVKHRQKGHVVFGEPIAPGLARSAGHCFEKDSAFLSGHIMSPPISRDPQTPVTLMDYLARLVVRVRLATGSSWSVAQQVFNSECFTSKCSRIESTSSVEKGRACNVPRSPPRNRVTHLGGTDFISPPAPLKRCYLKPGLRFVCSMTALSSQIVWVCFRSRVRLVQ